MTEQQCPICKERPADPDARYVARDSQGNRKRWCMECQDEFDTIDWGATL